MGDPHKCVLCGATPATTREHIPPESFFERPYPPDLITVPSCEPCNLGTHLDDDYALSFLVALDFPGLLGSPTLEKVRDRIRRGLNRSEYGGLQQRLRDASTITSVEDPQTGATIAASATRPEGARILAVLRKQVRGIAYHVTNEIVPRSTYIGAERTYGNDVVPTADASMWRAVADEALRGTVGSRGEVFRYAFNPVGKSACAAVVWLEYWEVYGFAAMIFQPGFSPPQRVSLPFWKDQPAAR
jgi:hypothetical protein